MLKKILTNKTFLMISAIILGIIGILSWALLIAIETTDWNPIGKTIRRPRIERKNHG